MDHSDPQSPSRHPLRVPNGSILQSYDCNELKRLENDSNDFEIASRKRAHRVSTSVDRSETSIDSQRSQNQSNFRSDARNKVATRASHSRPTQFLSVFSEFCSKNSHKLTYNDMRVNSSIYVITFSLYEFSANS